MRTTTVTCDRCRRAIEADMATIQCLGILKDALGQPDLCPRCASELVEWLRRGPAPEATPHVEPSGGLGLRAVEA